MTLRTSNDSNRHFAVLKYEQMNIPLKFSDVFFQHLNEGNKNVRESRWKTPLKSPEGTEKIVRHCESSK